MITEIHKLLSDIRAAVGACELFKELDNPKEAQVLEVKALTYDKIKEMIDKFYKEGNNE